MAIGGLLGGVKFYKLLVIFYLMKRMGAFLVLIIFLASFISAGITGSVMNNQAQKTDTNLNSNSGEENICCHTFGYGSMMEKVNSEYQLTKKEACAISEDFVGGGKEIVDENLCENHMQKAIQVQNRIQAKIQDGKCPKNCTCDGSTTKCRFGDGSREMTIRAGESGNIIVQVKGVNMSTRVALYKSEDGEFYGIFKNNLTREIKIMPDEIKQKVRERLQQKDCDCEEIELDEDGNYQVQTQKRARFLGMIPVREKVKIEFNSETGEITKTKTSWWGFLAKDVVDEADKFKKLSSLIIYGTHKH